MLALGGLAALRGFHAAAPFALGAASGATALAVVTQAAVAVVAQSSWVIAIRGAGTLLLVVLAMRILRSRAITDGCGRASNSLAVEAGTGFCTAIGNPVTIAYFTAEYASFPAAWPIGLTVAVLVAVPLTSATFYLHLRSLGRPGPSPGRIDEGKAYSLGDGVGPPCAGNVGSMGDNGMRKRRLSAGSTTARLVASNSAVARMRMLLDL